MSIASIPRNLETFECRVVSGHLMLSNEDGQWVVDTGSPVSVGRSPSTKFGRWEVPLAQNAFSMTADQLQEDVGAPIAGLIGMDFLDKYALWDPAHGYAAISDSPIEYREGHRIPITRMGHMTFMQATIGGIAQRMIFDTGAPLSYWQSDARTHWPSAQPYNDFHPSMGKFQTTTHIVPVTIHGDVDWQDYIRFGKLPGTIGSLVSLVSNGLIGLDVLGDAPLATYFPDNVFFLPNANKTT